jgi:hypothetical protein
MKPARRRAGIAVAVALALPTVGLATTASAAVPGLELVSVRGEHNSENVKVQGAPCPQGKRLLSSGARINFGLGQVGIDKLTPGLSGTTVISVEDQDGLASNWFVRAYSICADPLPGLQIVQATGPSNSRNKHMTAVCPVGKRLLGGGGEVLGEESRVSLNDIVPDEELTKMRVRGLEDQNATDDDWALRAYAICADPLDGLELVTRHSHLGPHDFKSARADCPSGKRLVGIGGNVTAGGPPIAGQVVLDDLTPGPILTTVIVGAREDQDGADGDWRVHAHAICATP